MDSMFNALGRLVVAMVIPSLLAACATVGLPATSSSQTLYAAHAAYNLVLGRFVTYAESPAASRPVVLQGQTINNKARPAFRYSEAYIACTEKGTFSPDLVVTAANIKCGDFKFDPNTLRSNSSILKSAGSSLLSLLGGGGK